MAEFLFDELLSPSEEEKQLFAPEPNSASATQESVNTDSNDTISETQEDTSLGIPNSKSMENILLENCGMEESIDLGNSSMAVDDPVPSDDVASLVGELSMDTPPPSEEPEAITESQTERPPPEENPSEIKQEETQPSAAAISKYFGSDDQSEEPDMFDALVTTAPKGFPEAEHEKPSEVTEEESTENAEASGDVTEEKSGRRVRIHLESHSSVTEEPTAVDFEEDKGELPLKPTPSTRSLTKFFSDDNSGDSKSFFDTFTAGEDDDPLNNSYPSLEQAALADTSKAVPMETPPIPTGSPIPSPFHQMSAPPSASESKPFFPDVASEQEEGQRSRTQSFTQPEPTPGTVQFSIDDPFTIGLNISDLDRRLDAWIPSEVTRQVLMSIVTSPAGSVVISPEQLTRPGLVKDDPLGDPVRELVQRFLGENEAQKRVCLTAENVPQDETGIRQLIKAECFRSAVDLTGRLLTQCGQGLGKVNNPTKHTPYTLQLWFCRIALLVRLHMYTTAEAEIQGFGNLDKPDLFFEYYQDKYPGRRGSMVPFGLRVLHAELPLHLGKAQESLDRLYYIHAIVAKILSNLESGLAEDGSMLTLSEDSRKASRELWEQRDIQLLYSITNCLLSIKDYAAALRVLEELLKKDKSNKDKLYSSVARIYLQMGDTNTAPKFFEKAEKIASRDNKTCQLHMNKGFLCLGLSQFIEAFQNFEQAVAADPDNAVAVNNMAVCALYTGHLTEALDTLENLVQTNPDRYLQEGILFNLCTLYELESSHAMFRKQKLLNMVSKHKGNGFNVACLKIV